MVLIILNDGNDSSEEKRNKLSSRMMRRGYCPCKALVVIEECLPELERRLDEVESQEVKNTRLSLNNFISGLVSKPGCQKTKQLPLRYDDLPDDLIRVKKCKIKRLEEQCQKLAQRLDEINSQITLIMSKRNSDDQVANLEKDKSQVETDLRMKQEELTNIKL